MADVSVSTWSEFLAAIVTTGNTVNVVDDITADTEMSMPVNMYATVNGNNHKIIGVSFSNSYAFNIGDNKIKNLHFVNIKAMHPNNQYVFNRAYRWYGGFENCTFAGIVRKKFCNEGNDPTRAYPYFKNCSFALRGYDSSFTNGNKPTLENCDFMLYGTWSNCTIGDLISCRIRGGNFLSISTSTSYNAFENCVIDAVISGDTSLTATNSIINADKVSGTVSGTINAVTSEQMTDIEYLNSIGFEVFPDVDNS